MIGLLKRFRELILVAVLLVLPLGVYFAHAKHPSERSGLDRVIMKVTAPIEKGIAWAIGGAVGGWDSYVALRGAHERSGKVLEELNQLRLERAELQSVREENERLGRLLGFARERASWRVVGGRVIGVRLDPKGLQLLTIDRGTHHGVQRLMPVVVGQGVVGRVHAVSEESADILVLTDRNSSIAVRVDRTRARANVRGTGVPDTCRLEYALRSDDMVEGDVLVTSGTDGVFPRGLPVGKLVGVKRGGQGLYQRAEVDPAVDITRLDELLVLTDVGHDADAVPEVAVDEPARNDAATKAAGPGAAAATAPTLPKSASAATTAPVLAKPASPRTATPVPPRPAAASAAAAASTPPPPRPVRPMPNPTSGSAVVDRALEPHAAPSGAAVASRPASARPAGATPVVGGDARTGGPAAPVPDPGASTRWIAPPSAATAVPRAPASPTAASSAEARAARRVEAPQ